MDPEQNIRAMRTIKAMEEKDELRKIQKQKQKQKQMIQKRRNSFPLDNPKKIVDESPIQQSQPVNQQVLEEYNEFVKNNPHLQE